MTRTRPPAAEIVREQLIRERRQRRDRWLVAAAAGLLLAAGIGAVLYVAVRPTNADPVPAAASAAGGGLTVAGDGPVTVEVYLDFLCPRCRDFEATVTPVLDQLIAAHKITLVWHVVSLLDGQSSTRYSTRAASSAACASDAGAAKLKAYVEALLARQPAQHGPGLTDDQLIDIGGTAGLNAPSFSRCVRQQTYARWVADTTAAARDRGVRATPAVFAAGQLVPSPTAAAIRAIAGA